MFTEAQFQGDFQHFIAPADFDAKSAANTQYVIPIPITHGSISIKEAGFLITADTSAASTMTTAGVVKLAKVKISDGTTITDIATTLTVPASTKKGSQVKKGGMSGTTDTLAPTTSKFANPPAFPEVDLFTHYLAFIVTTQGVGGTQNIRPWITYSIVPKDQY